MADYLDRVGTQLAQLTAQGMDRASGPTLIREPVRHSGRQPDDGSGPARPGRLRWRGWPGGSHGAGGSHGSRGRRRREALVIVPVLLVAVIVVVGLLVVGLGAHHSAPPNRPAATTTQAQTQTQTHHRSRHRARPTSTLSSKAPASATAPRHVAAPTGPVPPGFGAQSFTAVSAGTWWLLGSAPCSDLPCTSILRTDDGGQSFVGTPAPRTSRVSQLRYGNAADGFAYDSELWVTHDAGAHWHQVRLGGAISDMSTADGFAYALVRYGHKGAGRLERAPLGSDTWTTLTGAGAAYAGLWAHGHDVLVGSDGGAALEVSHDAGVTFTREASPSKGLPCDFQEPASGVVWAHCATGTESATWRSTNSGSSFQALGGPQPGLPNSALFAAASPTTAVLGADKLYRTSDGGAHYAPVSGIGTVTAFQYVGFTDATHGVAVAYVGSSPAPDGERLYITTDGGATYRLVSTG